MSYDDYNKEYKGDQAYLDASKVKNIDSSLLLDSKDKCLGFNKNGIGSPGHGSCVWIENDKKCT